MGRKILFITTDQQRYDALGCNGGVVARTPVIDGLAANGIVFDRAHPQNVVCMPSRSTMLTGQHVSTHGVWMNGVPLSSDAPSIATDLRRAGYRTALIGKAHFEPFIDPFLRFAENRIGSAGLETEMVIGEDGLPAPHRGFEHFALATHGGFGPFHYARWLREKNPEAAAMFFQVLDQQLQVNAGGGGDTNAPQVKHNDMPRELYHTEWVADQTINWLSSLPADADWFCWMSFPDPHHPWDPPEVRDWSCELARLGSPRWLHCRCHRA